MFRCLTPSPSPGSRTRHLEPSVQFSRTGLSCRLLAKGYETVQAGSAVEGASRQLTR